MRKKKQSTDLNMVAPFQSKQPVSICAFEGFQMYDTQTREIVGGFSGLSSSASKTPFFVNTGKRKVNYNNCTEVSSAFFMKTVIDMNQKGFSLDIANSKTTTVRDGNVITSTSYYVFTRQSTLSGQVFNEDVCFSVTRLQGC